MTKPMMRALVVKALRRNGCELIRQTGGHDVWQCPCGQHIAPLPRHRETSAGVVRGISKQMACLEEGWLQ